MKPVSSADLWGYDNIAAYIGCRPRTVRDLTAKRPGFPRPFVNTPRKPKWNSADIVRHFQKG